MSGSIPSGSSGQKSPKQNRGVNPKHRHYKTNPDKNSLPPIGNRNSVGASQKLRAYLKQNPNFASVQELSSQVAEEIRTAATVPSPSVQKKEKAKASVECPNFRVKFERNSGELSFFMGEDKNLPLPSDREIRKMMATYFKNNATMLRRKVKQISLHFHEAKSLQGPVKEAYAYLEKTGAFDATVDVFTHDQQSELKALELFSSINSHFSDKKEMSPPILHTTGTAFELIRSLLDKQPNSEDPDLIDLSYSEIVSQNKPASATFPSLLLQIAEKSGVKYLEVCMSYFETLLKNSEIVTQKPTYNDEEQQRSFKHPKKPLSAAEVTLVADTTDQLKSSSKIESPRMANICRCDDKVFIMGAGNDKVTEVIETLLAKKDMGGVKKVVIVLPDYSSENTAELPELMRQLKKSDLAVSVIVPEDTVIPLMGLSLSNPDGLAIWEDCNVKYSFLGTEKGLNLGKAAGKLLNIEIPDLFKRLPQAVGNLLFDAKNQRVKVMLPMIKIGPKAKPKEYEKAMKTLLKSLAKKILAIDKQKRNKVGEVELCFDKVNLKQLGRLGLTKSYITKLLKEELKGQSVVLREV